MSDQRVQQTQARLDDEARAESQAENLKEHRINWIRMHLNGFTYTGIDSLDLGADFLEWIFDKFEEGKMSSEFYCMAVRDWNLKGHETDTLKLAESFVDWIGD